MIGGRTCAFPTYSDGIERLQGTPQAIALRDVGNTPDHWRTLLCSNGEKRSDPVQVQTLHALRPKRLISPAGALRGSLQWAELATVTLDTLGPLRCPG